MPRIAYKSTAYCNRVLPRADLVSVGEGGEGALVQTQPEGRQIRRAVSERRCGTLRRDMSGQRLRNAEERPVKRRY